MSWNMGSDTVSQASCEYAQSVHPGCGNAVGWRAKMGVGEKKKRRRERPS
jgi:hypothetical protein